jgi:hypothetical protein
MRFFPKVFQVGAELSIVLICIAVLTNQYKVGSPEVTNGILVALSLFLASICDHLLSKKEG